MRAFAWGHGVLLQNERSCHVVSSEKNNAQNHDQYTNVQLLARKNNTAIAITLRDDAPVVQKWLIGSDVFSARESGKVRT